MLLISLAVLALALFPIFCVLYFVFSMFSDAPGSGAWLIPFEKNIGFFLVAWILVLVLFVLALHFKDSISRVGKTLTNISSIASFLFLIAILVISFSYKALGGNFGKDYFHVYYRHTIIDNLVDRPSFTVLNTPTYAKDNQHAFYVTDDIKSIVSVVPGVNIDTFVALDKGFAKDKDYLYFEGKKVMISEVNKESFTPINFYFAKDNNHVYYLSYSAEGIYLIPGADVETFEITEDVMGRNVAKDKNNTYINTLYDFSINGQKINSNTLN